MRNMLTIYRRALRVGVVIISTVGALLPWATLYAAPAYEITYLGNNFIPWGINDEGWVSGGSSQATLFAGRLRTIKPSNSTARAVNNSGEIVGSFSLLGSNNCGTTTTHAFRHRDTVNGPISEDLGSVANSNYSEAHGINNSGQVVGFARVQVASAPVKCEDHAFLYNDSMIDLALFVGMNHYAYDINDRGDIVGEYKTSDGVSHAFLRTNDGVMNQDLPLIGTSSVARAVNNLGHVVGNYTKNGVTQAFLFAGGSLKDLGTLPDDTRSYALDINDKDQIVGYSVSASGVKRAFLYDGAMTDLSTTTDTASGVKLEIATAINNKGEIVGHYASTRSYRLSPTPRVEFLEHPKLPWNHLPESGDYFGSSIALHGDTLVAGAPGESGGKGAVYVYRFENGGWIQKQRLTALNPTTRDRFGSAVAFDGTTLVISAPSRNSAPLAASPVYSGSVLVYSLQNQQWTFNQEFAATDATSSDQFGYSVALFEQTLLVGIGARNAAYIFTTNNGPWTERQKLTSASSGALLKALAVRNNTLVLSSMNCTFCIGQFNIYERDGTTWKLTQSIDMYAYYWWTMNAVALTDTRIALGNYYGSSVDIYERSGLDPAAPWIRMDSINRIFSSANYTDYSEGFGSSLAGSGDQLLIGAAYSPYSPTVAAVAAYLYERVGPYWVGRKKITPRELQPGNLFGYAVAISGNTVAVGTNFATGSAHVFSLCASACADIFSADVAVNITATANKVPVLGNVTLHVTVTNNDTANTANGVMLEVRSPTASYVSVPTDCVNWVDKKVCHIGSLGPGVAKTYDFILTAPGTTRDMVTDVLVKSSGPDPNPANNAQTITTEVTPLGEPSIKITGLTHLSADKTTLVLTDDDTASVSFILLSVHLSSGGNKVAVELDGQRISDRPSSAAVDVGPFSAGAHTVTVLVHDAKGTTLASDSISFTVRLLVPGLFLTRPQHNDVIECGLDETVLMDYRTPNWSVAPNGKYLDVVLDQQATKHDNPQTQAQLDLCALSVGDHELQLRLVNAAGEERQSVAARFTVRRVSPNVVLTVPKEGGRYLRGFDMVYEFVHTTPDTRAQMILNDAPPQKVDIRSRTLAISAEELLPEKNRIVLQLFDGDRPLPEVTREFYVQDAATDAPAPNTKSGGGAVGLLVFMWMVALLSFRLRWERWRSRKNTRGEENKIRMKKRMCAAIALFTLSVAGAQAAEYRITDLGYFDPLSINDKGWVAGTGTSSGQASLFAGRLRTVQPGSSIARAVNDKGQIVGTHPFTYNDSGTVIPKRAFRYADTPQGPLINEVGVLPNGDTSEAFGINNSGHVVGYARIQTSAMPVVWEEHAFLYVDTPYDLGTLRKVGNVNTGSIGARAYDINDQGDIVGCYEKSDKTEYAFLISKTIPSTLPKLNGARSVARAVNNPREENRSGLVVGWYVAANGETHGFLYNPGSAENPDDDILTDLPPLTGDTKSDAFDINDRGQIVGYSSGISNGVETRRAVLYENGVPKELTPLLTTTTGWILRTATAINNNGEIAGVGAYNSSGYLQTRGYRLSPQQPMSLFEYPRLPETRFPGTSDYFGQVVAISGDTMVVGAWGENGSKGAAYIYTFVAGAWKETQRLAIPDAASYTYFGNSVAIDGSTLLVGAFGRSTATVSQAGAAFIYERAGDQWGLKQEIVPKDASSSAYFGSSVAIHNKTILIGARQKNAAYVFTLISGQWTEQQKLTTTDSVSYFGSQVAVSHDTIVVKADGCGYYCVGFVYIFQWIGTEWSQLQRLTYGSSYYVKLLNNRIFIGYSNAIVDVYEPAPAGVPTPWILTDQVAPFGEKALYIGQFTAFGQSIAIDGDLLLVGAPNGGTSDATSPHSSSGSVYIYERVGPYWVDRKVLTASDAQAGRYFGTAVALSGNSAVVGTNFGSGAAYAYAVCSSNCEDIYTADLALTLTPPTPNKVAAFGVVSYRLEATNRDTANTANNVQVRLPIPDLATFDSASSQCSATFGSVVCGLGSLAPGATVTLEVSFAAPPLAGNMTLSARISAVGPDPDSTNSNVTTITEVTPPGAPQIRIVTPTAAGVTRFEGDDLKLEFRVDSVLLSKGGNVVEVEWKGTKIRYHSQALVSLGAARAGPHTVKVILRDNQNAILAQDEVTFEVKVVTPSVLVDYPKEGESVPCDGTSRVAPRFRVPVMPSGKKLELLVGEQLQMRTEAVSELTLNLCAFPQDQEHILTLRMVDVNNAPAYSTSVSFRVVQARPKFELTVPRDNGLYSRSTFEMVYKVMYYKPNTSVELRINGNAPILLSPELDTYAPPSEQLIAGTNTLTITLYDGGVASPAIERTFNLQDVSANADAPAKSGGGGVLDLLVLGFFGLVVLRRLGASRGQILTKPTVRSRFPRSSLVSHPATYKSHCVDRLPGHLYVHSRPRCSGPVPRRYQCRKYADRFACPGSWPMTPVPPHVSSLRAGAPVKTPVNLE